VTVTLCILQLVTSSEGSASDVGRTFSESGSEPLDQQSVLSDPDSTGAPRTRGPGSGDSRPPSFQYVPFDKDYLYNFILFY
jgi:hypothetical protein